jgi:hypothetical protein
MFALKITLRPGTLFRRLLRCLQGVDQAVALLLADSTNVHFFRRAPNRSALVSMLCTDLWLRLRILENSTAARSANRYVGVQTTTGRLRNVGARHGAPLIAILGILVRLIDHCFYLSFLPRDRGALFQRDDPPWWSSLLASHALECIIEVLEMQLIRGTALSPALARSLSVKLQTWQTQLRPELAGYEQILSRISHLVELLGGEAGPVLLAGGWCCQRCGWRQKGDWLRPHPLCPSTANALRPWGRWAFALLMPSR